MVFVSGFSIRDYRESDKMAIIELNRVSLENTDAFLWNVNGYYDDLNDIAAQYLRAGRFFVGEVDGRIVATGAVRVISEGTAEVKRIRVHPDFQRKGIGQSMLSLLERTARGLGCTRIVLDTTIKQTAAQAMYLKNSYRELRRERIYDTTERIYYEKMI